MLYIFISNHFYEKTITDLKSLINFGLKSIKFEILKILLFLEGFTTCVLIIKHANDNDSLFSYKLRIYNIYKSLVEEGRKV